MNRNLYLLLLLFLVIAPLQAKTILIVGDSLSAGYGIEESKGWVKLLQVRLKTEHGAYQVVNISSSGDTTSNGLAKLKKALSKYKPVIVIIELGANDGLRGLPTSEMQKNLEKMISVSQKIPAKVLLLATLLPPNYGALYLKKYTDVYTILAKQYNLALVPMFLNGIAGNPALMQQDGLHPNQQAQEKILDNVWPALKPLL